jgi:uncharacterized membrane protein
MTPSQHLAHLRSATRRLVRENGWLLPAIGGVAGIVLALAVRDAQSAPDPGSWAVSVDRARDTLVAALAIVFTGLGIVLALAAMISQNAASRFSIRLLRIQQRRARDKLVIGVFTMTTAFIVTTQVTIRSLAGDRLAPPAGLMVSVLLVILSGATIIWYISTTMRSLRLDRTMQQVTRLIRRTMRSVEHGKRLETPAPGEALVQPTNALPIRAPRSGYIASIDTNRIYQLATPADLRVAVEVVVGDLVVDGQQIGWITPNADGSVPHQAVSGSIEIVRSRDPDDDVAYGIRILVDIALMALSPAVNDPYTAVEVVNELTFVLLEITQHHPGPRGRAGPGAGFTVVRATRSLADYVDLAADQILLYGHTDPEVREALSRLAVTVEAVAESETDKRRILSLAQRVALSAPDGANDEKLSSRGENAEIG